MAHWAAMDPGTETYLKVLWLHGTDAAKQSPHVYTRDSAVLAPVVFRLEFDDSCLMLLCYGF